jgi:hypothetical protein
MSADPEISPDARGTEKAACPDQLPAPPAGADSPNVDLPDRTARPATAPINGGYR